MKRSALSALPYRSDDHLDAQLAEIGYAAAYGWPDQRPITADLVASRLTPPPGASPTFIVIAQVDDRLVGWGAVRPAPPGGTARLWGPLVHPDHQGGGVGHDIIERLTCTAVFAECQDRITTAEIPSRRHQAIEFFERAGWVEHSKAVLLHARPIPAPLIVGKLTIDTLADRPVAGAAIADLYRASNPHQGAEMAATALQRWSADRRYSPADVLVAHTPADELVGVALLYPLGHVDDSEPSEVLLADVLLADETLADGSLDPLVAGALAQAAATHPAAILRAITTRRALAECLMGYGASLTDQVLYYAPALVARPPQGVDGPPPPSGNVGIDPATESGERQR